MSGNSQENSPDPCNANSNFSASSDSSTMGIYKGTLSVIMK